MTNQDLIAREMERKDRLLEFVKGELRNMYVGARLKFTSDLFVYLSPEITELAKTDLAKPK
jgi:hypothetical protein